MATKGLPASNPFSPRFRRKYHVQTVESVKAALMEYGGNMSAVAKVHGVTRAATTLFIDQHAEELRPVVEAARLQELEQVDHNMRDAARKGEYKAARYYLDCHGRQLGWGRPTILSGPPTPDGSLTPPVFVQIVLPDNYRGPNDNHSPERLADAPDNGVRVIGATAESVDTDGPGVDDNDRPQGAMPVDDVME